jgi:hypothetical protein
MHAARSEALTPRNSSLRPTPVCQRARFQASGASIGRGWVLKGAPSADDGEESSGSLLAASGMLETMPLPSRLASYIELSAAFIKASISQRAGGDDATPMLIDDPS